MLIVSSETYYQFRSCVSNRISLSYSVLSILLSTIRFIIRTRFCSVCFARATFIPRMCSRSAYHYETQLRQTLNVPVFWPCNRSLKASTKQRYDYLSQQLIILVRLKLSITVFHFVSHKYSYTVR